MLLCCSCSFCPKLNIGDGCPPFPPKLNVGTDGFSAGAPKLNALWREGTGFDEGFEPKVGSTDDGKPNVGGEV